MKCISLCAATRWRRFCSLPTKARCIPSACTNSRKKAGRARASRWSISSTWNPMKLSPRCSPYRISGRQTIAPWPPAAGASNVSRWPNLPMCARPGLLPSNWMRMTAWVGSASPAARTMCCSSRAAAKPSDFLKIKSDPPAALLWASPVFICARMMPWRPWR